MRLKDCSLPSSNDCTNLENSSTGRIRRLASMGSNGNLAMKQDVAGGAAFDWMELRFLRLGRLELIRSLVRSCTVVILDQDTFILRECYPS